MIRVLIDASNCGVGGGAVGRHLLAALDAIADPLFELSAIVPSTPGYTDGLRHIRVLRVRLANSAGRNVERARHIAESGHVDIFHALTCEVPPMQPRIRIVSFTNSNPYTPRLRGWTLKDRFRLGLLRRRYRRAIIRATHAVTHSMAASKILLRHVIEARTRGHLLHPLAVTRDDTWRYEAALTNSSCLLCPAAYLPHKNLKRLIEAYEAGFRSGIRLPLVIAGHVRQPYYAKLERFRKTLNSRDSICLLESQSEGELERLYARALAVVVPSYEETFSLPVVEAVVRGIPVLCSDPGEQDYLPYSEFGAGLLHFDPFDVTSIGAAILQIVKSEERRKEISRTLRSNATPRSWPDYAGELLDCYRQLLAPAREYNSLAGIVTAVHEEQSQQQGSTK